MNEVWKTIEDFPNYQISNLGNVKSQSGKILSTRANNKGYLTIDLRNMNKRKCCFIHRLIAQAFIPNPNNYPIVNHKDENPLNNNIDNLEWCTQKYNMDYGTINFKKCEKLGKKVYQYSLDKKIVHVWNSIKECRRNGYNVWDRCNYPQKFNKPYKGFLWSYYDINDKSEDNYYILQFYKMI